MDAIERQGQGADAGIVGRLGAAVRRLDLGDIIGGGYGLGHLYRPGSGVANYDSEVLNRFRAMSDPEP